MSSSIPSHVTSVEMSVSFPSNASKRSPNSQQLTATTPTPLSGSGMSGLLNSRHLVQDEKLAVATLATLQSGSASTLIKQDLKWIIQSRRRAEGKSEIQVEFKKPIKDELTSEEVVKRARRRELNRLAARRSREKGQRKKDRLVEEICQLQSQNSELIHILGSLTDERDSIIETLRQHMKSCSEYTATRYAANGLSQDVLEKLGFADGEKPPKQEAKEAQSLSSHIYLCTSPDVNVSSESDSPPLQRAKISQSHSYSSCPSSPVVIGLSGKPLFLEDKLHTAPASSTMRSANTQNSSTLLSSSSSSFMSSAMSTDDLQGGSQISPEGDQRLLRPPLPPSPPPPLPPLHPEPSQISHRRCNSSHAFEPNFSPYSSEGDDPVVHTFARPISPERKPLRVSLERSFSFPSSHCETKMDFVQGSTFTSVRSEELRPSHEPLSGKSDEQEAPLDLVVRNKSGELNPEAHISSCKDERSLSRRRSVDDGVHIFREPLNLSRKCVTSLSYPHLPQESGPFQRDTS